MRFEDQCRYKYLINSASIGYANKFKSLLLCGSVVLYIRDGNATVSTVGTLIAGTLTVAYVQ